eukprot:7752513-Pyramimonas_sp.AAC.1
MQIGMPWVCVRGYTAVQTRFWANPKEHLPGARDAAPLLLGRRRHRSLDVGSRQRLEMGR